MEEILGCIKPLQILGYFTKYQLVSLDFFQYNRMKNHHRKQCCILDDFGEILISKLCGPLPPTLTLLAANTGGALKRK